MTPRPFQILLPLLALAPVAASAQNFPNVLKTPAQASLSLANCLQATNDDTIGFTWTRIHVIGETEKIFVAKTDTCSDDTTTLLLQSEQARDANRADTWPRTGDTPLTLRKLFEYASGKTTCEEIGELEQAVHICVRISTPSTIGGAPTLTTGNVKIVLDTKPPPVPTNVKATPKDKGLLVSWEMPSDILGATRYRVYVDGVETKTETGTTVRESSLESLTNGKSYKIQVTSIDASGTGASFNNESAKSTEITGVPQDVQDFLERYHDAGGTETGGCSQGAGNTGLFVLVALLAGLLLRRRRGAVVAVGLLLAANTAFANENLGDGMDRPGIGKSPRHFTFELRTGAFLPNVDSEFTNGKTPYADIFGTDWPMLTRLELGVDVFKAFGRLSLGVSLGSWTATGKGRYPALNDQVADADAVYLVLQPITPVIAYRADFIEAATGIPLVPYGKVGFGITKWATSTDSKTSSIGTAVGEGWATGLEFSGGLQLGLNTLEPDKGAAMDQDFGVNEVALFFDYTRTLWKGAHGLMLQGDVIGGGILFSF